MMSNKENFVNSNDRENGAFHHTIFLKNVELINNFDEDLHRRKDQQQTNILNTKERRQGKLFSIIQTKFYLKRFANYNFHSH
jgi:hypothetical protein